MKLLIVIVALIWAFNFGMVVGEDQAAERWCYYTTADNPEALWGRNVCGQCSRSIRKADGTMWHLKREEKGTSPTTAAIDEYLIEQCAAGGQGGEE